MSAHINTNSASHDMDEQAESSPDGRPREGEIATRPTPQSPPVNYPVFIGSALIVAVIAIIALASPQSVEAGFTVAVDWISHWFGSFYIFLATFILVFVVVLALSKFGNVRLGPDNATPDFSTFSWAAMLFAAGIGTDIMFFAVAEPIAQYMAPPTGEAQTVEAARAGVVYTLFHYGITGWGMYALVGIALGYFAYRHQHHLAVRSALRPLFGKHVDGPLGNIIDGAVVVGGVFGIAASLGVGIIQLNVGLTILFGLPQATSTQIGLIALSVIMATVSAVSGVDRGVRVLSNVNVLLAIGLAVWVLVTQNTAYLLDSLVRSVGDLVRMFPALTLETYADLRVNPATADVINTWLNSWTLFFWAWWITWAAFVGMFLARISRGRTIREFVMGSLILPLNYVIMWVSIFGNAALELVMNGDREFAEITVNAPEQGFYALLQRVPGSTVVVAVALFVGILFYVTSADSGSLVMSNLSSRITNARQDAVPWLRIFWATLTGVLTIAMLVAGGLTILQQATIVMALPFSFVLVLVMIGLWRSLSQEASMAQRRRRIVQNRVLASGAGTMARRSWRDRLSKTFDVVTPVRAQRVLDRRVVPALQAVADELHKEDLPAWVVVEGPEAQDPDGERNFLGRVTLTVGGESEASASGAQEWDSGAQTTDTGEQPQTDSTTELHEQITEMVDDTKPRTIGSTSADGAEPRIAGLLTEHPFRYTVRVVESPVPSVGTAMVAEANDVTVRLEVRPSGGGQGYDIVGWSSDQIAHDVLDHYEGWLDYLGVYDE
ncbi:choline BCCT transporter BetT [Pauljensenia sp. UMB10120]|nr:choline BCCT transporter BetT [Pauljensenia sp. UMB10120]MDK6243231.1 choline BCCT transporter BetT [Pauljensenia sp. UMB10120]